MVTTQLKWLQFGSVNKSAEQFLFYEVPQVLQEALIERLQVVSSYTDLAVSTMLEKKFETARILMHVLVVNDKKLYNKSRMDVIPSQHRHAIQDAIVLLVGTMSQYVYTDKQRFCHGINLLISEFGINKSENNWMSRLLNSYFQCIRSKYINNGDINSSSKHDELMQI